jgi:hypothetical protein
MASDLTVQTIRGPGSGANANQILIPTGQKIIASDAGAIKVPGQIVQEIFFTGSDTFTSTASAWVQAPVAASITPKYANSIILGFASVNVWRSSYNGYFGVKVVNSGGDTSTPAIYGDGYFSASGAVSWDTPYQWKFNVSSTSTITSTFYIYPNGGTVWFPNNATTFSSTPNRWSIRFTEVAQ